MDMFDRRKLEEMLNQGNIRFRFWGRRGKHVVNELEEQLNFKFSDEVRFFIEEIGNLDLGSYDVIISGDEEGSCNSISESEQVGLFNKNQPSKGVKIMDSGG